jgi:hypothetical protein
MAKDNKLWIDMCAGSELKDTQGETLSVEGADISDLENGKGRLNDNHGKGFFNSLGRVTEAKKIFKSEDCENDRHKYYWEKIKAPFIYAKGYLFSNEDHPNAKAAAAILRNIHREDAPLVMKASVEGGVVARGTADPSRLARTKIHSVALTFTPANNATLVEPINLNKSNNDWESDKQLIKSVMHLAETNVPSFRHIQRHASANSIHENILKIQELSKAIGIQVHIELPEPEVIMKNAVFKKIENNVKKINELVKNIKVNHMAMLGSVNRLESDPKSSGGFTHPEFVTRWHGKGSIPQDHPDHQEMVNYINKLKNTPDTKGLNVNVNEARRLYNDHINKSDDMDKSDVSRAVKGGAIALAMGHAVHYMSEPPVEVKNHAVHVHKELESQKATTLKEHNSRLASEDIKLSNKEYGFDEKEPNVPNIEVKKQKLKNKLKKALLAGYGGAGAPTGLVGGGVIQPESLDSKRKKKLKKKLIKNFLKSEDRPHDNNPLLFRQKDAVSNLLPENTLYHGTPDHPFKTFGATAPGKVLKGKVNALGPGHYFTTHVDDAIKYGKYIGKIRAELSNPALSHEDVDSSKISDYINSIKHNHPDHAKILSNYIKFKDSYKDYLKEGDKPSTAKVHQMDPSKFPDHDITYKKIDSTIKSLIDNQDTLSEAYNQMLSKFGHDGIINTGGGLSGATGETVFFNSKDIGDIDWHEYDENEDLIRPLKDDPDIYDPDYHYAITNSYNMNKSLSYISCDNCGHEQVFMPHQVKCRECKQNFSLYRLNSLKS